MLQIKCEGPSGEVFFGQASLSYGGDGYVRTQELDKLETLFLEWAQLHGADISKAQRTKK